ncbi:pentapeptide repeat-containing protein [Micromonospora sp. NPDC003241]
MPEGVRWYKRFKPVAALRQRWFERKAKKAKADKSEKSSKPRTYKPIHLATLIALTIIALVATGVASYFMWDAAKVPAGVPNSPDLAVREAQLRVDVIRNILAVGAGTGGLIALFLALRRQYVKERVDHADQEHKNRTAEDAKHDASEKRITELYVKAAEQLGSDKAPVRMAALYSLERLAQDNPGHRQMVTNLICSYLRMPFTVTAEIYKIITQEDDGAVEVTDPERFEELEIRLAAQEILSSHLVLNVRGDGGVDESWWGSLRLNLRGATLLNLDLDSCRLHTLNIEGAYIVGATSLFLCILDGRFMASRAVFDGRAGFVSVSFAGHADFTYARFLGPMRFSALTLRMNANFDGAKFENKVVFDDRPMGVNLSGALASQSSIQEGIELPIGYRLQDHTLPGWKVVQKLFGRGSVAVESEDA